jgi:hypothetical protein
MLLGSQHFKGVEGHARAPGWDSEELTSFNYSHEPVQTNMRWLMHSWSTFGAMTSHGQPQTHKTHHSPNLGEATTFPLIVYFAPFYEGHIQMTFCLGTPKWESQNLHN